MNNERILHEKQLHDVELYFQQVTIEHLNTQKVSKTATEPHVDLHATVDASLSLSEIAKISAEKREAKKALKSAQAASECTQATPSSTSMPRKVRQRLCRLPSRFRDS